MTKFYTLGVTLIAFGLLTGCGLAEVDSCLENPFGATCGAKYTEERITHCTIAKNINSSICVVNTDDLPAYPIKATDIQRGEDRFLTAQSNGEFDMINLGENVIVGSNHTFMNRRGGEGSKNPDGFVYFITFIPDGIRMVHDSSYAGILSTTNLGKPLTDSPTTAVWPGHFSHFSFTNSPRNAPTNFYIDFTNQTFGFANETNDGIGTFTHSDKTYNMNGFFGTHVDAIGYSLGRIGGSIAFNLRVSRTQIYHVASNITGLIGVEGIVGVFAADSSFIDTVGGFTATNPDYDSPN